MSQPMISVLLSVHNGERFIAQAVQSILDQTYRNFELLIIDDGSTDNTAAILDGIHDSRIRRMTNAKNMGLIHALNRAAAEAKGIYLVRMDADDVSHPLRFARQIAFLEEHPKVGVLGTAAVQVDHRARIISHLVTPAAHELILWYFFFDLPIIHATVMMRSNVFRAAGGYNPLFVHAEDIELWSRLLFQTQFANLQDVLYQRRLHRASIGNTKSTLQICTKTAIRKKVLKNIFGAAPSDAVLRWFADPFHVLGVNDEKELMDTFFNIYNYIVYDRRCPPSIARDIRDDLFRRIHIAEHSTERPVRKYIFRLLRDILPIATRHKLKTSKLGYFFANRI